MMLLRIAAGFGARLGISGAARLAGLLHDLGKYSPLFQARLDGAKEPVDHSTAGAALALQLAGGDDRVIAELIAYAIAGHHAGLPDRQGESRSTLSERLAEHSQDSLDPNWTEEVAPTATGLVPAFQWERTDEILDRVAVRGDERGPVIGVPGDGAVGRDPHQPGCRWRRSRSSRIQPTAPHAGALRSRMRRARVRPRHRVQQ